MRTAGLDGGAASTPAWPPPSTRSSTPGPGPRRPVIGVSNEVGLRMSGDASGRRFGRARPAGCAHRRRPRPAAALVGRPAAAAALTATDLCRPPSVRIRPARLHGRCNRGCITLVPRRVGAAQLPAAAGAVDAADDAVAAAQAARRRPALRRAGRAPGRRPYPGAVGMAAEEVVGRRWDGGLWLARPTTRRPGAGARRRRWPRPAPRVPRADRAAPGRRRADPVERRTDAAPAAGGVAGDRPAGLLPARRARGRGRRRARASSTSSRARGAGR